MYYIFNSKKALFLSVLFICVSSLTLKAQTNAPPSQNSPPSTEQRLDRLENQMGQILTILQNQQAGKSEQNSASASQSQNGTSSAGSTQLVPGPILHIYSVQGLSQQNANNPTTLLDGPPSEGEVAKVIDTTELFRTARLLEEPSLQDFTQSYLGYLWAGDLVLRKGGPTVIVLETDTDSWASIKAVLTIGGQEVTRVETRERGVVPSTQQLNLPQGAGVYKMQLWVCIGQRGDDLAHYKVRIKIKEGDDTNLRVITKDDLMHKS